MENYVAGQLAALGAAVALGAAGGLVYDLLRVLRRRRPGLTHAADAVIGGMCLLGALWALTRVGGGEPQLYLLLGAGAGMLLYLLAAAPLLRPLWEFWADVAGELARLLVHMVAQAHLLECGHGAGVPLGARRARQRERQLHVGEHRLVGDEVVALEHEADAVVAVGVVASNLI